MHGLVLAGGEGTRLRARGLALPKPLVEIGGQPQVVRLLETLQALGCRTLTCAVREEFAAVRHLLATHRFAVSLNIVACRTPSSLHTLVEGLKAIPPGAVFCSMVDTVMRQRDWQAVYRETERRLVEGADAVLAVTPYVDDESPVYVGRHGGGGVVHTVRDEPVDPPCVTGGVYGLSPAARRAAEEAVGRGLHQMRRFLQAFVAAGHRVAAVEVPRIIDVDRPSDLAAANAWLTADDEIALARLVAIYRSPSYSPRQHGVNDTAILDATVSRLAARGWTVARTTELEVAQGCLPAAELYLNMCQGSLASERLLPLESAGVVVVNRPSSVLNCHRQRLVQRLAATPLAFPHTVILPSSASPSEDQLKRLCSDHQPVWVKRGDVHAERSEDVVATAPEHLAAAMAAFAGRGIPWVALQEHVSGPIVKFYGVSDGRFFRWYGADAGYGRGGERPPICEDRLQALAFEAAAVLGLEVFGGDVAFPAPDRPVLIDLNDWPSFAPFRDEAGRAIADFIHERMERRT